MSIACRHLPQCSFPKSSWRLSILSTNAPWRRSTGYEYNATLVFAGSPDPGADRAAGRHLDRQEEAAGEEQQPPLGAVRRSREPRGREDSERVRHVQVRTNFNRMGAGSVGLNWLSAQQTLNCDLVIFQAEQRERNRELREEGEEAESRDAQTQDRAARELSDSHVNKPSRIKSLVPRLGYGIRNVVQSNARIK